MTVDALGAWVAKETEAACAERNRNEAPRRYLGMSSIGHPCERRSWLGFNRVPCPPLEGRVARIFDMGHAVEARVINDLRLKWRVTDEQAECVDLHGRFRGHIDGIVWIEGKPLLLEIKSANNDGFNLMRSKGISCRPQYHAQVVLYMRYMGLSEALFMVENKNSQELHAEVVPSDPEMAGRLKEKALSVLRSAGPPPADKADCRWCDWRDGACGWMDLQDPLCMRCGWYVPRFWLEERGTSAADSLCLKTLAPARPLDTCGSFTAR
ncbi:MAG: hypothetical protein LBQ12_06150 [Deltaproteobacteria bacterium]|nr:hypothetical protein [Deltaproteobacteria bacterium]